MGARQVKLAISLAALKESHVHIPSARTASGTPAEVSNVLLENKEGAADTITVKYTPPTGLDIAGAADSAGSYR